MPLDLRAVLRPASAPQPTPDMVEQLRQEKARRQAARQAEEEKEAARAERQARRAAAQEAMQSLSAEAAIAEKCRRSLHYYFKLQWANCQLAATPLEDGRHIKAICDHIQGQLEDSERKRENLDYVMRAQNLLINCPPRSLKTIILSLANAWAWIRWPSMKILYVSSTPKVVLESARYFRDAITSVWYQRLFIQGAWKIRADQDALGSIGNTAGGKRTSMGFAANVLGLDSDWLNVDDAHQMDDSPELIMAANVHYDGNLSSRMNDPRTGIRTAIMQRAALGDFSAHVIELGWFHLCMPMEYEVKRECRCSQCQLAEARVPNAFGFLDWRSDEGEILHPRFTREYLAERMLNLRPHGYAGQMQQRPSVKEGNQFKVKAWRFATIDGLVQDHPRPHLASKDPASLAIKRKVLDQDAIDRGAFARIDVDWVCLSVDCSNGSANEDASALGLVAGCGIKERRVILGDYTPGPRTWLQTINDIKLAVISVANLTGWHDRFAVLVEKKALGPAALDQLREAIADGLFDRWGRAIHPVLKLYEPTGKGNKEQRAEVMEPLMDSGLLYLLDCAPWLCTPPTGSKTTLVDEFAAFPKGDKDDRVDSTAQMIDEYRVRKSDWMRLFS